MWAHAAPSGNVTIVCVYECMCGVCMSVCVCDERCVRVCVGG